MTGTRALLAVDLGLRTGIAFYNGDGRLRAYRSHKLGSRAHLQKAAASILREDPNLTTVVLEGGGDLALIWEKEAHRRGLQVFVVDAHTWRRPLLLQREQRKGADAKQAADERARAIIEWSGAKRPTSLTHDAAEAILVGLWGVLRMGWLEKLPPELAR